MKKVFTLLALALSAVAVSAQTVYNVAALGAKDDVVAATTLVDDDILKVETVYGTKITQYSNTYQDGAAFTLSIQLRVNANPSAEKPEGTEQSNCTPLVITAKKDAHILFYYQRQAASGAYASNDGKDIKVVDQSAATTVLPSVVTFDKERAEGYAYVTKAIGLEAGKTYTVFAKGTTVAFNGFKYGVATATIPSSGYASYSTFVPVDLSSLSAAYVVSALSNTSATLAAVDAVPAYTGVILNGAAGTVTIPVATTAPAAPATNFLKAAVAATDVAANSAYVLNGGKFCPFTATSVPAGKAYLLASDVPVGARELSFDFGGETTGISTVKAAQADGTAFNLAGQRVAQPTKGLYIIGGKKVIVK